jgi:hypothetical protein
MLRDQLVLLGWKPENDGGLPTIINPAATIALCINSGDENTGNASKTPSTKHHKGARTVGFVVSNQMALFEVPSAPVRSRDGRKLQTWTLLFYEDAGEIREELSLPVFIDGGQINGWTERIILPAIPLDGGGSGVKIEPDFGPDIDIDIRRLG